MEKEDLRVARTSPVSLEFLAYEPTEKVQLVAVDKSPNTIRYFTDPSVKVQMLSLDKKLNNLQFINNPDDEVVIFVLDQEPTYIKYVDKPYSRGVKNYLMRKETESASSVINVLEESNEFVLADKVRVVAEDMSSIPDDMRVGGFDYELTDAEDDRVEYKSKKNPGFDILVLLDRKQILIMQYTYELINKEFPPRTQSVALKAGFELAKELLKKLGVKTYQDYIATFVSWQGDHDLGEEVLEDASISEAMEMEHLVERSDFKKEWRDYKIVSDTY